MIGYTWNEQTFEFSFSVLVSKQIINVFHQIDGWIVERKLGDALGNANWGWIIHHEWIGGR